MASEQEQIEKLLQGEGRVKCERYSINMPISQCLDAQRRNGEYVDTNLGGRTAYRVGCLNCEQGREIMRKQIVKDTGIYTRKADRELATETKVEEIKSCIKCGHSKTFSEFGVNKTSPDGRLGVCKECRNKKDRMKKLTAGRISLNFDGHPDLLDEIKAEAVRELRAVDMQILYLLERYFFPKPIETKWKIEERMSE